MPSKAKKGLIVPSDALTCLLIVILLILALLFLNCIVHKRWKLIVEILSKFCPCLKARKKSGNLLAATKDTSPSSDDDVSSSDSSDNENDIEKAQEGHKLLNEFGDIRSVDQSNISSSHTPPHSRFETPSLNTFITNDSRAGSVFSTAHHHKLSAEESSVHLNFKIFFEESLTQLIVKVEDVVVEDDKFLRGYVSVHGALVSSNKTRRFQTKTKRSTATVIFDQIFVLTNVTPLDIETSKLRVRLYHLESKTAIIQAKKKMAEKIIALHQLPSSVSEERTFQAEADTDQKNQLEPFENTNDKNSQ